jgi:DNA-binding MarR family transcriptional regulator
MLNGAMYPMRRPRARRNGKEVELPTMARLRDRDLLDTQMLSRLIRGISARNYAPVIDELAEKTGVSKSSVSRAFKRSSKKDLDAINGADLTRAIGSLGS